MRRENIYKRKERESKKSKKKTKEKANLQQ